MDDTEVDTAEDDRGRTGVKKTSSPYQRSVFRAHSTPGARHLPHTLHTFVNALAHTILAPNRLRFGYCCAIMAAHFWRLGRFAFPAQIEGLAMATARALTFADLLRRHRSTTGLSQEELAVRAGLSRSGISELERGLKRAPHKDTVARLADALALSPHERAAASKAAARGRSANGQGGARPR